MPRSRAQQRPADAPAGYRFENPRAIRALAHPARMAIINALATGEELTATQCAELTGLSPSATAYHLKLLEQYGFAETAPPRPDRRERPWRAAGRRVDVDVDTSTPAGATAAAGTLAAYLDTTRAIAVEFVESSHAEPQEWQDVSLALADLWLTREEFARVARELSAVLQPYRGLARQPDSRRVRAMTVVVPHRGPGPEPD